MQKSLFALSELATHSEKLLNNNVNSSFYTGGRSGFLNFDSNEISPIYPIWWNVWMRSVDEIESGSTRPSDESSPSILQKRDLLIEVLLVTTSKVMRSSTWMYVADKYALERWTSGINYAISKLVQVENISYIWSSASVVCCIEMSPDQEWDFDQAWSSTWSQMLIDHQKRLFQ